MGTLLSSFEKNEIKKPYQTYTLAHGIESFRVKVPLAEAAKFEAAFNSTTDKSKQSLQQLIQRFGGLLTEAGRS